MHYSTAKLWGVLKQRMGATVPPHMVTFHGRLRWSAHVIALCPPSRNVPPLLRLGRSCAKMCKERRKLARLNKKTGHMTRINLRDATPCFFLKNASQSRAQAQHARKCARKGANLLEKSKTFAMSVPCHDRWSFLATC